MSQPKVFEFAKEIGMETLALMDRIREWQLPVKSHMAELSPEIVDAIREKLQEEQEGKSGAKKAKKKTKAKAKKKTAKKVVVKKSASTSKVIRRKASAEEAEEVAEEETAAPATTTSKVVRKRVAKKADEDGAESAVEAAEAAPAMEPEAPAAEPEAVEAAPAAEPAAEAAEPAGEDERRRPVKPRMREVTMTSEGPVSGIKSERPKRNIVGRMDLSRVQDLQNQRQGARPQARGNLRTGFIAQTGPGEEDLDLFAAPGALDARKKFDERGKRKVPAAVAAKEAAATVKEKEVLPPAFTASEFRKREMVFQPKKKKGMLNREARKTQITTPKASKRVVRMYQNIKVSDLAQELGIKVPQLSKVLMTNGIMAKANDELDFDTVSLIVPEFGYEAQNLHRSEEELVGAAAFGDLEAEPIVRPPIVTVMGHVDHGKTTLLDTIRKANVVKGEAGGITQHIGAYQVDTDHGRITFIDTPGHEAFTAMRARGANVTDIAIIVVAADDGVMPQTIEAISHAKAAEVPIIVAVNKIDKPQATPDRVKQQLTEYELIPEEWGGNTIFVNVSALNGEGIPELLDQISLLAEIQELKANPKRSATGVVIESKIEKGRGAVATVLIQDGTLTIGQTFVAGTVAGRVRSLIDYTGKSIKEAGPSVPVELMGLPEAPQAGDPFDATVDEKNAERVAEQRKEQQKRMEDKPASKLTLEDLFSKVQTGEVKELPVVLKTDVAGSAEAIIGMFEKLGTDEVKIKVIHHGVGGISESDVLLASTANGIIIGFNTRPDGGAQNLAKQQAIEIKTYSIVYELMDDMKKAMSGLLDPDVVEVQLGRAQVRETFSVPKIGTIAGSYVEDGKITRNSLVRLVRDGVVVYEGTISSLKRFKDDAREVQTGFECGIGIENFNDIKVGDVIEAFIKEERQREL